MSLLVDLLTAFVPILPVLLEGRSSNVSCPLVMLLADHTALCRPLCRGWVLRTCIKRVQWGCSTTQATGQPHLSCGDEWRKPTGRASPWCRSLSWSGAQCGSRWRCCCFCCSRSFSRGEGPGDHNDCNNTTSRLTTAHNSLP